MIWGKQMNETSGGKHVKFGIPRGAVKEKFCEETPSEAEEGLDPRCTSRYTIVLPMHSRII
jgi:hypothetical protein